MSPLKNAETPKPAGSHKHPLGHPKQVLAVDCEFDGLGVRILPQ